MSKYIGTKAVNLSTTSADVTGNADIDGNLTVGGNLTVSGTTITVDHATAQTVDLGDNDKIRLGDDNDLQIYYDGTHSYIDEQGTGSLQIRGTNLNLKSSTNETYLYCVENGEVGLQYDNALKLATTSTGVDVSDTATNEPTITLKTATASNFMSIARDSSTGHYNFTSEETGSSIQFFTDPDGTGADKRLTIDRYGDISFYDTSGNAKLFWDSSEESLTIGPASSTVANLLLTKSGSTEYANMILENSRKYQLGTGGGATGDYADKFYIYDSTAGAPRLSLDSSGRFGLGTMNPAYPLTLYKTDSGQTQIQFQNSTTGNSTGNGFGVGLDTQEEAFLWSYDSNDIYFGGSTSGVAMRITSSGDVKVEKNLTVKNQNALYFDNTGGYSPRISNAEDQNQMSFYTNNTERMRIGTDGAKFMMFGSGATTMASFGGTGTVNGVAGSGYQSYTPFSLARDSGTSRSAWFAGNLKFDSGYGIDFSATGDGTGTATSEIFDDYEEGTFTPTLYGHTTAGTASGTLTGKYTKVGRKVFATVQFSAVSLSSAAGRLYMGGLPYTSISGAPGGGLVTYLEGFNPAYFYTADSDSSALSVVVIGSGTFVVFRPTVTQSWDNFVNAATSTWNNGGGSTYGSLQFTYMTT